MITCISNTLNTRILDTGTNEIIDIPYKFNSTYEYTYSCNNSTILAIGRLNIINLFYIGSFTELDTIDTSILNFGQITALSIYPIQNKLIIAFTNIIVIYNIDEKSYGKKRIKYSTNIRIRKLCISPDEKYILHDNKLDRFYGFGKLKILNNSNFTIVNSPIIENYINHFAYSPTLEKDSEFFVYSTDSGFDGMREVEGFDDPINTIIDYIKIWKTDTNIENYTHLYSIAARVNFFTFIPNMYMSLIVNINDDNKEFIIYNINNIYNLEKICYKMKYSNINSICHHSDNIVAISTDSCVLLYNLITKETFEELNYTNIDYMFYITINSVIW